MEKERKTIEVGMAEVKVSASPEILITRGLGSCVGIALYDPTKRIGALAHPMLPDINKAKVKSNPAKFVNSVIDTMLEELKKRGCIMSNIRAKLFGGGHMFTAIPYDSPFNIGVQNIEKAKDVLSSLGIRIVAEDSGGNFGRTIHLDLATGKVKVITIFHGEKEL